MLRDKSTRHVLPRRRILQTFAVMGVGAGSFLLRPDLFFGGWDGGGWGPGDTLAAGPRYYIRLRTIELAEDAAGAGEKLPIEAGAAPDAARQSKDAILEMARKNLLDALHSRPEVVMEFEGVAVDAPPARYQEELNRRKLKGYEVTLRITKLERSVMPPPPGRKFRMLEQSVKLKLVGTLYPGEPTLVLGGDGESTVQIEVGAQISENQERDVMTDVLKDAIGQAVTQALRKLEAGPMKPPKDPPRRRK